MSDSPKRSIESFEAVLPVTSEPERKATAYRRRNGEHAHLDRETVLYRATRYLNAIPPAIEGQGGDKHTFITACKLVRDFDLDEQEALNLLSIWNASCQPPWTELELQEKIRNAAKYGENPIGCKAEESRLNGNDRHHHDDHNSGLQDEHQDAIPPDNTGSQDDYEIRPSKYSDDALADRFSARYEHELQYVPTWGWLEWTGKRWRRISDVLVMERARPVCRSVSDLCKEDKDLKPSTREALARSMTSAKTVAAVERLARGDRRHYSEVHQWDRELWAFNTPGGTIDLRTGSLRPHRREDRITKIANATPEGACPRWLRFINKVTGGVDELESYLQRLAGYGLVGDPREECLDFFYGSGGNGKGTFLSTLEYIFGEYATTAGTETFVESSKGDKHPCDIAKLAGARLVISNEIDEGQRWDEARIKNLTGRDVMTARFMRQDFFDFLPQFTLIIAGNHKPTLKTVDESVRRRFHLVPFNVTIPAEEQNTNLKTELREEANGILAWAVAGCMQWQQHRLNPPAIVLEATAEYLASEDVLEMWFGECCIRGPYHEERTALLYESFRQWKQERGEQPPGQKTFTTRLTERGFSRDRDKHGWKMLGLRLTDDERKSAQAAIDDRKAQ